ncbi:MAG: hypothetical protein IJE62_06000 [Clostridia bacterium]|nr:hypothetical protein [Clostridia bacterium]
MGNKSELFKPTNETCKSGGFTHNIVVQSDDHDYIRKYIEMGLGISFVPSPSWKGTFSENVAYRQPVNIKRYTFVYLNTQKYISKAIYLFLDSLLNIAKEYSESN